MDITEAAAALSVRESEITAIDDSPAGPIITTTDGVRYVIVPDDQPDADGATGIMFLAAPNETGGSWPIKVYAQPGAEDTDPAPVDPDTDPAPVDPDTDPAPVDPDTDPAPVDPDTDPAPQPEAPKGKGRGSR